jgi:prepilin-type N-terminal cleavage/methylation domain-containing protein
MKCRKFNADNRQYDFNKAADRPGVTLTEVLMSLMIMGVGISAVAVLFPIAVLRSIQATQLTNAAVLKQNVEGFLQLRPQLVFDPDGAGGLTPLQHARGQNKRYLVDPIGFAAAYELTNAAVTAGIPDASRYGRVLPYSARPGNPTWDLTSPVGQILRYGGGLESSALATGLPGTNPDRANTFRAIQTEAARLARSGDSWRTVIDTNAVGIHTSGQGVLLDDSVDLSDFGYTPSAGFSWIVVPPFYGISLPAAIADPENYRVTVFSRNGKASHSYPLTAIHNFDSTLSPAPPAPPANTRWIAVWSEDIALDGVPVIPNPASPDPDLNRNGIVDTRTLPAGFVSLTDSVRVLIENKQGLDYSWILSVRRSGNGDVTGIDAVIRFNGTPSPDDEISYRATFVKNTNLVGLIFPDGITPSLKKGGAIFDAENGRWYRVSDYVENPAGSEYDAIVYTESTISEGAGEDQLVRDAAVPANNISLNGILDRFQLFDPQGNPLKDGQGNDIFRDEDKDSTGNNDGNLDFGAAILLPGIVEVYPMRGMVLPDSL